MASSRKVGKLLFCILGIYSAYLTQGIVQERLSTTKYEPDQKHFRGSIFLNLAQAVTCFVYAFTVSLIFERGPKNDGKTARFTDYIRPSLSNSIGPALGVQALQYISYPAQVLAKSCKMIPVMIVGTLFYKERYSFLEYVCAVFIASGISMFALFKQSSVVLDKLVSPNAPLGYSLVFLNLFMDGYTNSFQDNLKKKKPQTSSVQFMCWINFWCSIFSIIYQFGFSDIGMDAIEFMRTHPESVKDTLLFCACGVFGQQFIFLTISSFGALVNVTITTTRKFINILLSVIINGTALMPLQWTGVIMVFTGLTLKEVNKAMSKKGKNALAAKAE